jgi:hypothetical protein
MSMRKVSLYQIAYSPEILANLEPGYLALDIADNPRPDWREYYPIRRFLQQQALEEDCYYAFLSPKFSMKTGLTHAKAVEFIQSAPEGTDVVTFSPQPDMGAFFLNVFEQNELFDPGFMQTAEEFFQEIGMPLPIRGMIMDSRQIVFSNFFAARPAFWREWLAINERMYQICEGEDTPLKRLLCFETTYLGVQRKVFLMERIASLLLAKDHRWKPYAYNTFACAWSASRLAQFPDEAVISDALKLAMREQGQVSHYVQAFAKIRDRLR